MSDLFDKPNTPTAPGTDNPGPVGPSLGADGKPRRVFDCSMMRRFPGKERNLNRELDQYEEKAAKSGKSLKARTARMIAADLAAENEEKQTETKTEGEY